MNANDYFDEGIEFIMKRFSFLLLCFSMCITALTQKNTGRRIYLPKGVDQGCMFMSNASYQPGDTLVISAASNPWDYVYFGGIKGTAPKPVIVINEGVVEFKKGISIENSQYIRVTGSGSKEKFGFRIMNSPQVAVVISGKSAHIEVERFYAEKCMFGCWIKNEADCDTSINNWVLNDMRIHDFEMHNMAIEGFYMGSTDPNNFTRPKDCNGVQQHYRPSKLGNIKIYNGYINGTGRPAIMLSNAQVGMSEIYNNTVMNVGREYNDQQGTGISIGGYTRAYVHDNVVKNTYTWGIASLGGSGMIRIENNKVDSSGYLDGKSLPWPQNIMLDTRPTIPVDSTSFIIRNNILSHPGKNVRHIEIFSTHPTYASGNIICNNKSAGKAAEVFVAKGIKWKNCKGESQLSSGFSAKPSLYIVAAIAFVILLVLSVVLYFRKNAGKKYNQVSMI
jgi:hypothetical protein